MAQLASPTFKVTPLSTKPPTGKNVAWVNCSVLACASPTDAATALGWSIKTFSYDISKGPQDMVRATRAALGNKPDYLLITAAFPMTIVSAEISQAKAAGIPVVAVSGGDKLPGVLAVTQGAAAFESIAKAAADEVLASAGGPVEVATPVDPTLPTSKPVVTAFKAEIRRLSPKSKVDVVDISLATPQTGIVSQTTNFLSTHSSVKYVAYLGGTALYPGVSQALESNGLASKVKIVLSSPAVSDLASIKSGAAVAGVASIRDYLWQNLDIFARDAVKDPTGPAMPLAPGLHVITAANATTDALNPPNYQAVYKAAWHLS